MKHSPTPWTVEQPTDDYGFHITDENGDTVCDLYYSNKGATDWRNHENAAENARRIVASVHFCDGIDTNLIGAGKNLKEIEKRFDQMRDDKDELLKVLWLVQKHINEGIHPDSELALRVDDTLKKHGERVEKLTRFAKWEGV